MALLGSGVKHRLIYSHDNTYEHLLEDITKVHVLTRKPEIDIPQQQIKLSTDTFFEHLRLHKTIQLDKLLVDAEPIHKLETSNIEAAPSTKPSQPAKPRRKRTAPAKESTTLIENGDIHTFSVADRHYRIGGLHQNNSFDSLRISLRATCQDCIHADTLDLYRDIDRSKFIQRAAEELIVEAKIIKSDLGQLILALEQAQELRLESDNQEEDGYELTDQERKEALEFLQRPDLLENIRSAYQSAGIIGESTNTLAAYLSCTSRKLDRPLAIIIQSSSAAGKSKLMESVLNFFPPEQKIQYSAMTGQSLYYLGDGDLKHKILSISEEEGAEKISYALKILQTEGSLKIASTGKDPKTGRIETHEYGVEGPVAMVLTTTSIDIDEELLNRCLLLTVDESEEQTLRIQQHQRHSRTVEGIIATEEARGTRHLMQNVQRLIRPMRIVNPYAEQLTFTSGSTRTRRDHEKYLTLIDTIALLHQHQREPIIHEAAGRIIEMLPVTPEDIIAANRIASEILGNNLDELPPQSRNLLESIKALIRAKRENSDESSALFTRKEVRQHTGWSYRQVRRHLERLQELEYVQLCKGRNGVTMKYKLLVSPEEATPRHDITLINPTL